VEKEGGQRDENADHNMDKFSGKLWRELENFSRNFSQTYKNHDDTEEYQEGYPFVRKFVKCWQNTLLSEIDINRYLANIYLTGAGCE